jgi:hypothetical protein
VKIAGPIEASDVLGGALGPFEQVGLEMLSHQRVAELLGKYRRDAERQAGRDLVLGEV